MYLDHISMYTFLLKKRLNISQKSGVKTSFVWESPMLKYNLFLFFNI